jgi:hypothetical protein
MCEFSAPINGNFNIVLSASAYGGLEVTYGVVGVYETSIGLSLWTLCLSCGMDRQDLLTEGI